MSFDQQAVRDVFDRVQSHAMALGVFERVNTHEPKSKLGTGMYAAIWVDSIRPVPSGQAATDGVVSLRCRIYTSMLQEPQDAIDLDVLTAVTTLMNAYSGDFGLGGVAGVRSIDLLGMYGESLSMTAGYLDIDRAMFRIATVVVPMVINDLWSQGG